MSASGAQEALSRQGVEWFRTTHWSVVLLAGQGDDPGSRRALEALCQAHEEVVREEIAHTVTTPAELEEELRHLLAVMSS